MNSETNTSDNNGVRSIGKRVVNKLRSGRELQRLKAAEAARRRRNWENAREFGAAYRRIAAALQGKEPKELGPISTVAPTYEESNEVRKAARVMHDRALLAERLQQGMPLEEAVAEIVRARITARDHIAGRSISQALLVNPTSRVAGHVGSALVATHMQFPKLA